MLLKIIKNKWTNFIILGLFVVVPIGIQISQVYFGDKTPHGDWLGFWGSYLGIIPSGLIAYFVAKTQVDGQRKIDQRKQAVDLYIADLKKLNDLINELRIQSRLTSMLIEKLRKGEIDLEKFCLNYNTMASEKRLGLKYNEYIENMVEILPNGSASGVHEKVSKFNNIIEQLEVNVEMGVIKIEKKMPITDDEFKNWLISDGINIRKYFQEATESIRDEISKYYYL